MYLGVVCQHGNRWLESTGYDDKSTTPYDKPSEYTRFGREETRWS